MDTTPMVLTLADVLPAGAEIVVGLAACLLLLVDAALGERGRNAVFVLAIAALAGAAWATAEVAVAARTVILHGHFVADPMGTVLKLFAYGAAAVTPMFVHNPRAVINGDTLHTDVRVQAPRRWYEFWR